VISNWEEPRTIQEVRSFIILVRCYHRFVEGYSNILIPLSELLKKNKPWNLLEKCHAKFYELKHKLVSTPMLELLDFEKSLEVQTNTLDFSIRGFLSQDGHLVTYTSINLQNYERGYPIHEKEITIVVHYLQIWRYCLLGKLFVVKIDNVEKNYFSTQPKLSPKKAWWKKFLGEFDVTTKYGSCKLNATTDTTLSRKAQLLSLE
jgi:hypothetical protein